MHIKMGVIVFDIHSFNWNQAAESPSPCFDGSMVSISKKKRGFLSGILRNTRFPFQRKTKRNTSLFYSGFMVNWYSCFFLSCCTCNGHWVKGSHSFCLPLTHVAHKSNKRLTRIWPGLGKHLVIFASASQSLTRLWSRCVYSIFSNYTVAGCSPEVTWTNHLGLRKEFPQNRCCPKIPRSYGNKPAKREGDIATSGEHEFMAVPLGSILFPFLFSTFHLQNRQ